MDAATKAKFVLALHKHSLRALDPSEESKTAPVQRFANGGTAAAGALGGAGTGALVGSVVPGVGTAIGAVGGALLGDLSGLLSGDSYQAPLPYNPADVQTNEQLTENNILNQEGLAGELQAQSLGVGPNPAQSMLDQTTQKSNQEAAALIASRRGLNPYVATQMGLDSATNNNQVAAGQAATMNAQQQLAAEGTLGSLYGQIGGQTLAQQQTINGATNSANAINAGVASQNTQTSGQLIGGAMQGAGAFAGMKAAAAAYGGEIPDHLKSVSRIYHPHMSLESSKKGASSGGPKMAPASLMKSGGKVSASGKSERAVVKGDSPKNDKIPAILSSGEIVIPRHITMGKNAPDKAAAFVQATLNKRKMSTRR